MRIHLLTTEFNLIVISAHSSSAGTSFCKADYYYFCFFFVYRRVPISLLVNYKKKPFFPQNPAVVCDYFHVAMFACTRYTQVLLLIFRQITIQLHIEIELGMREREK